MINKRLTIFFLFSIGLVVAISSCKKDNFITSSDARLSTSVDSLRYDTVFTSVGSITQSFKINNLNDQKLLLSSVKLMGGSSSPYKINVNGLATTEASNVEINANDSIYVFVSVNIDPTVNNLPFIVSDSIQITYNGNKRFVQLESFGQNAYFLRDSVVSVNTSFQNDKPYVILGSLTVNNNVTLNIPSGARIYAHANAPIIVDGTLNCNGTYNNQIVFNGDRLDNDYKDLPASWPGIYFRQTSKNNNLIFTQIRNAYQAVVVYNQATNLNPKVTLSKCIIDNTYDAGIYSINSSITADNCLISNCGDNIKILYGGKYNFTNCTVASYGSFYIQHKNPVLFITNHFEESGTTYTEDLNANFTNCIFWGENGNVENEISTSKKGANSFAINVTNCIYKAKADPDNVIFTSIIKNQKPEFDSIDVNKKYYDFQITKNILAPGLNAGATTSFTVDLNNNPRVVGSKPDIGCYEKQ